MAIQTNNSRLRKYRVLLRTYRAILVFVGGLVPENRDKIERYLADSGKLKRREILSLLTKISRLVRELSSHYGFKGKLSDLEELIDAEPNIEGEAYLLLSKHYLQQLFSHYERALPIFPNLSPHARISIDVVGYRQDQRRMEFLSLEASLFEDMATLWNDTVETSERLKRKDKKGQSLVKRKYALTRATAKAAFNLLEGYLNGIALDILLTQRVTKTERIKLKEWDDARSRPQPLSLRDKLLQYPKMSLKKQHPPLDKQNCPEMATVLQLEQRIRHSLIHPKPIAEHGNRLDVTREEVYIQLSMDEAAELCDLIVDLIERITVTIGKKFGAVDWWLYRRDSSGKFPEESFI